VTVDAGLRKIFADNLRSAQWQSVETWSTGSGTPDAEYCFPGGFQGWVEYKRTAATAVRIASEQVAWAERRARMGGRIFLAVRKLCPAGPRRKPADELFLYLGRDIRKVYEEGLAVVPLDRWPGGPARWDWAQVQHYLTS
jgi:hypothetical protein